MQDKTTKQVAALLGKSEATLRSTLHRYQSLRPIERYGWSYVWTDAKIEALRKHYAMHDPNGGRPKQGAS